MSKPDDLVLVHTDSAEVKLQEVPPRSDGRCQYCGGETDTGYGLAGGGCGVYHFCLNCGRVTNKWEDPL